MKTNLSKLQTVLKENKITYYLIPSEDPHQSEYVDDSFKFREYISGFPLFILPIYIYFFYVISYAAE